MGRLETGFCRRCSFLCSTLLSHASCAILAGTDVCTRMDVFERGMNDYVG